MNTKSNTRRIHTESLTSLTRSDFASHFSAMGVDITPAYPSKSRSDAFLSCLESILQVLTRSFLQGDSVYMKGLGHMVVLQKKMRPGRNPKTGESNPVSPRRVVSLRKRRGQGVTLHRSDIALKLHKGTPEIKYHDWMRLYDGFIQVLCDVKTGEKRVEIRGFGVFCPHYHPERTKRNPKTGELIACKPAIAVKFKSSKELFEMLQSTAN